MSVKRPQPVTEFGGLHDRQREVLGIVDLHPPKKMRKLQTALGSKVVDVV